MQEFILSLSPDMILMMWEGYIEKLLDKVKDDSLYQHLIAEKLARTPSTLEQASGQNTISSNE